MLAEQVRVPQRIIVILKAAKLVERSLSASCQEITCIFLGSIQTASC